MKAIHILCFFLLLGLTFSIKGQSNIEHIMKLKNGATFKVTILELSDSSLSYLSGDHEGKVPVKNIEKVSFVNTGYVDRPYSVKKSKGSHLMELKDGSTFVVFVDQLNDSVITYSAANLKSSISLTSIKKISILKDPKLSTDYVINPNIVMPYSFKKRIKDTTPIFKPKGIIGFMDIGIKFGIVEEDGWSYVDGAFFIDGGIYVPKGKNLLLGGSVGVHDYSLYNAALMPFKAQAKYILTPQKRRSVAANVGLGYSLQIADERPFKSGGLSYNFGLSLIKSKKPKRVNEWNFGFLMDQFESVKNIGTWDPTLVTFTTNHIQQYATARRFYISKKWWFK